MIRIWRLYGAVFRLVLACAAIPFYMQPLNPQDGEARRPD